MPGNITKKSAPFEWFSSESKKFELLDFNKPIIVSCESIVPFTEKNIISDDGLVWYIDFMYFDMLSRNNNFYPADDTKRSFMESTWIQENIRNRTMYGELEHPPAEDGLSGFMFIEPPRYAWNILSLEDKGDHFSGKVGLCAPLGTSIVHPNIKMYGCNYGASCRISTPNYVVKEQNGRKVYVKKYKMYPITPADLVTTCGLPPCRLIKDGEYQAEKIDLKHGVSSTESSGIFIAEFSNPENTIKEMLKSEESGRIISDIFGIDYASTKVLITKDKKVKLCTGEGIHATIPLNSYILSDVLKMK